MLADALSATLPLIAVYTTDTINLGSVLSEVAGSPVEEWSKISKVGSGAGIMFCIGTPTGLRELYGTFAQKQTSLIVVNPEKPDPLLFDAGVIPTPASFRKRVIDKVYGGPDKKGMDAALLGLTYKEMIEIIKLTTAMFGQLTPVAVIQSRRECLRSLPGLKQVPLGTAFYAPPPSLLEWLALDGKLLQSDVPQELWPRGMLFTGMPGTGKTMGAKFIAQRLGLPLYHLEVGTLMSKYVGESEHHLSQALAQIEQFSPCIMLLDEVEKLFTTGEDGGTTSRLLSTLLWWLQEHTSRVATIMTTNDLDAIPPELYRPGRIDVVVGFHPLKPDEVPPFVLNALASLSKLTKLPKGVLKISTKQIYDRVYKLDPSALSQALIMREVLHEIKQSIVDKLAVTN